MGKPKKLPPYAATVAATWAATGAATWECSLTAEQIRTEQNAEVRRVLIERFGAARYAKELGAKVVHEDEYGKLLRADVGDTEPYCFVEVLNSTPEPDGTVKTYTLRVPPTIRTCREGLAWTFEMPEAEMYAPEVMT